MVNHFRMPRPLVGIGHSFGAAALTKLALFHPRLFSALVLVDPVISTHNLEQRDTYLQPPAMSAKRRDVWPSREEAAASFQKSKFYQSWDPRAFDRWVAYGLSDLAPGTDSREVTLTTTKHQEVFTFARMSYDAVSKDGKTILDKDRIPDMDLRHGPMVPIYRPEPGLVFEQLQQLRPWVMWVFGGKSYMSMKFQRDAKTAATGVGIGGNGGMAAGRVEAVVGEDWGHLIPLEAPGFVAHAAAGYAADAVNRWEAEERDYEAWTRKSMAEKSQIRQEALDEMAKILKPKGTLEEIAKTPKPKI